MTRASIHGGRADVPRLHVVTDDRVLAEPDFVERAREVLRAGGPRLALHLRAPERSVRMLVERVAALGDAARASEATLVVNDRVDVAMAFPAAVSGVHLRGDSLATGDARRLLPDALVGRSVHGVDEVGSEDAAAADYLVVGTVWATPSHPGRPGACLPLVREAARAAQPPMVAIGGVTVERAASVRAAGGHGVAVLRAVWDADDPADAVCALLGALVAAGGDDAGANAGATRVAGSRDGGVQGTAGASTDGGVPRCVPGGKR